MLRASEAWTSRVFPEVVVFAAGRVPVLEGERFARAVGRTLQRHGIDTGARVRITGPATDIGPFLVQVNLSVGETPARVQIPTRGRGDALPAIKRLDRQISLLGTSWCPRPWPQTARPQLHAESAAPIARRKILEPAQLTPQAAARAMDSMDYDAHLFTDVDTGEDAIIFRGGPYALRLARQRYVHPPADFASCVVVPRPAPALTELAAVQHLCRYGLPFLFYSDPRSGRGRLLYCRYDGRLALVAPPPLCAIA